jgi:integrase
MTEVRDIYHRAGALERLDQNIAAAKIDAQSKAQIKEFKSFLIASGLGTLRISKYIYTALRLRAMLKKPLKQATKKDIVRIVEELEKSKYAPWTKHSYKLVLKKLYLWLETGKLNGDEYPEIVDWIPLTMQNNNHRLPESILTEDEIRRLVGAANNPRDKAFVFALWDSGCRIGEFLGLRRKHVEFDDFGCVLHVSGKTGGRRIRLIGAAPSLGFWLDNHPHKDDQDSPVWTSLSPNKMGKPLDYGGANKLLRTLARRAKIEKKVNPHSFRHSRASALAASLSDAVLKEFFGWTQGSKMAMTYIHLSGKNVDHALLELYGLKKPENKSDTNNLTKKCPRCSEQNSFDARVCQRCALPLDVAEAKRMEAGENVLKKLLNDPRSRKGLVQLLYQIEHGKK